MLSSVSSMLRPIRLFCACLHSLIYLAKGLHGVFVFSYKLNKQTNKLTNKQIKTDKQTSK